MGTLEGLAAERGTGRSRPLGPWRGKLGGPAVHHTQYEVLGDGPLTKASSFPQLSSEGLAACRA